MEENYTDFLIKVFASLMISSFYRDLIIYPMKRHLQPFTYLFLKQSGGYVSGMSPRSLKPSVFASCAAVVLRYEMAGRYFKFSLLFWTLFFIILVQDSCLGKEKKPDPKKKKEKSNKIGKNIMDYTEADMHKLLDQWDVSTSNFYLCILGDNRMIQNWCTFEKLFCLPLYLHS